MLYKCGCGGEPDYAEKEIRTVSYAPMPREEPCKKLWAAGCTKCGIETAWHATKEAAEQEWNLAMSGGPKQGAWEFSNAMGHGDWDDGWNWRCSVCKVATMFSDPDKRPEAPFCQWCGADMRGPEVKK